MRARPVAVGSGNEAVEQALVLRAHDHVERCQHGRGRLGIELGGGAVADLVVQAGQLDEQRGPQPGKVVGVELTDGVLEERDRARLVSARGQHAGPGELGARPEARHVDVGRAALQLVTVETGRRRVPQRQRGLDGDGQQFDGAQAIGAEHAEPASGGGTGQLGVASLQVQLRRWQERLERLLLPEQQLLGLGQTALADPQVGQGDGRVPARHLHGRFEVGLRAGEHGFGVTPAAELHEQRGLHAVAVAGQEDRRSGFRVRCTLADGAGRSTSRPGRSRPRSSTR